jgi:hypothetical protein
VIGVDVASQERAVERIRMFPVYDWQAGSPCAIVASGGIWTTTPVDETEETVRR